MIKYNGGNLLDVIKHPINTLKESFSGVPTKLNNRSRRTMEEYGAMPIKNLILSRTKLNNIINESVNFISGGKFNEIRDELGYDNYFHLSLIAQLNDDVEIIIEKNEVVNIELLQNSKSIKQDSDFLSIGINKFLTLADLIENTLEDIGPIAFYDYTGLEFNCQRFITDILISNGEFSKKADDFINQDIQAIREKLKENDGGFTENALNKISALGSISSRLIGKGKKNNNEPKVLKLNNNFKKYMKNKGFALTDIDKLFKNKKFINYIRKEGFVFL